MRSIIKLAVAAAILSIGSTQAFADSNLDSGKIDECANLKNVYNTQLSPHIPDEHDFKAMLDSMINSKVSQATCTFLTSVGGVDFWVDYYRLKINTKKRHYHFRIKPLVGPTIKINGDW